MASMTPPRYTNALIDETSPYLLQHAHNPVHWMPWGEKARNKARDENKPIIVSIGYSACHWCHVMEKESFENTEVAEVMNRYFVCIKVDREERPDIDQVYMDAVQLMQKQGGWPLNCVTTPDGKPVFGGTYFSKENWIDILVQLNRLWQTAPNKFIEYGEALSEGMQFDGGLPLHAANKKFQFSTLREAVKNWKTRMDAEYGGANRAPKFPMPSNYIFLLRFGFFANDAEVLNHVERTLDKLSEGGIFDHIDGGFMRYATDSHWKVPHFEKMLYDNAQLMSLFAEGYQYFQKPDYLLVIERIADWLKAEMENEFGGYFSAIDADSDQEEGKYYTFRKAELEDAGLFEAYAEFYFTDQNGTWEGKYIPVRKDNITEAAKRLKISIPKALERLATLRKQLHALRKVKTYPAKDDKTICSWNALMATGFLTAYQYTGNEHFLKKANRIFSFIETEMQNRDAGTLSHTWKTGKPSGIGFLEDYAFLIQAYLKSAELNFDRAAIDKARGLTNTVLDTFYDAEKGLFFMTAASQDDLLTRPVELNDNVIPSGNSVMAQNLHTLSTYFNREDFSEIAERILGALEKSMVEYPEGHGNAADLYLRKAIGTPEIVITGSDSKIFAQRLSEHYFPNLLWAVTDKPEDLPIFADRIEMNKTRLFICQHKTCGAPISDIEEAKNELEAIKSKIEFA